MGVTGSLLRGVGLAWLRVALRAQLAHFPLALVLGEFFYFFAELALVDARVEVVPAFFALLGREFAVAAVRRHGAFGTGVAAARRHIRRCTRSRRCRGIGTAFALPALPL